VQDLVFYRLVKFLIEAESCSPLQSFYSSELTEIEILADFSSLYPVKPANLSLYRDKIAKKKFGTNYDRKQVN
jgi:hypothetical protein